jgi:hypothetical protein
MHVAGVRKWVGGDYEPLPNVPPPLRDGPPDPPAPAAGQPARWPQARLAAVEALWGAGFVAPGGPAETLRLARPLGLNHDVTLLLLGGGAGGPAETISGTLGAWVHSFEADSELAAVAEKRRRRHPLGGRMQVHGWDRASPNFRRGSAHHALSLEALRGAPAEPLLASLAAALRPKGHIVLTELVAEQPAPQQDREFAAWCRLEDRAPDLPSRAAVTNLLVRLGFEVQLVEDISERHVTETLAGWRAAVRAMASGPRPGAAQAGVFVTEAELWLLRIRLMRRLGLNLMRWHAVGAA